MLAAHTQRQHGDRWRGGPARDHRVECAAEWGELERELTGEMIALEKQFVVVDAELSKMTIIQEEIIRLRFCEGKKRDEIAEQTHNCIR